MKKNLLGKLLFVGYLFGINELTRYLNYLYPPERSPSNMFFSLFMLIFFSLLAAFIFDMEHLFLLFSRRKKRFVKSYFVLACVFLLLALQVPLCYLGLFDSFLYSPANDLLPALLSFSAGLLFLRSIIEDKEV